MTTPDATETSGARIDPLPCGRPMGASHARTSDSSSLGGAATTGVEPAPPAADREDATRPAHDGHVSLSAHAIRSCPLKTFYGSAPGVVRPRPPADHLPMPGSEAFRERVADQLVAAGASVADLREPSGLNTTDQRQACLDAMAAGTDVILGGLLPRDDAGHRHGRVPVLIRDVRGGYRPVLVRFQRVLQAGSSLLCSSLNAPLRLQEAAGHAYRWQARLDNALQLAHYWRMLDAFGQANEGAWGGVIGLDDLGDGPIIAWLPLQAADNGPDALALYDAQFAERLSLAQRASAGDSLDDLGLEPARTPECDWCDWWPVCAARLGPDDLSARLPNSHLNRPEILALRRAGVRTVADMAGADLDELLETAFEDDQRAAIDKRLCQARHRAQLLLDDVELERTTSGPISVPRAELEIDIDLETSRDDRVYLWGFYVTDQASGETGYHPFAAFDHMDERGEADLAHLALTWLRQVTQGRDALVYHYSDYETVRIAKLAESSGDEALAWARDWARTSFVDLFKLVKKNFFGTHGLGLKAVAHAGAGFSWRDPDPGGVNSMRWFEDAVVSPDPAERDEARRRVLAYNEDDVRATVALRRWLSDLD